MLAKITGHHQKKRSQKKPSRKHGLSPHHSDEPILDEVVTPFSFTPAKLSGQHK
jgi:hypothetical protein